MVKKTHYTDNLFFINEKIKALETGLKLKLDAPLFFDNIIENTMFIDEIINTLFSSLKDNPYILGRIEYLRVLVKTESHFLNYLEKFLENGDSFGEAFTPFKERFQEIITQHRADLQNIHKILADFQDETVSDIVSEEEFSFLLKTEPEEKG